ncbi:MAG: hypothetical protein FJ038_04255 [Chloroflexi bacterium]|nr:hypothetical protein [Chloroflexota bacterium]
MPRYRCTDIYSIDYIVEAETYAEAQRAADRMNPLPYEKAENDDGFALRYIDTPTITEEHD